MAYFVVLGNTKDRHEITLRTSKSVDWTINPKAVIGDQVLFYVIAPVKSFVATGEVASLPKLRNTGKWAGSHYSKIENVRPLTPYLSSETVLRHFPSWRYMTQPHPSREVPSEIVPGLVKLMGQLPSETENGVIQGTERLAIRHQVDPVLRKEVEDIAVAVTWNHFGKGGLGYELKSVEGDNVGWDLKAISSEQELQLEVKGLSGTQIVVELTPNEYKAMKSYRPTYRVCVVSNALVEPVLHIFRYNVKTQEWESDDGRILNVQEMIGVRCSAANV